MPDLSDITVRSGAEGRVDVSSHLTRGRVATVGFLPGGKPFVVWALIPSYRQGITESLILAAVVARA